MIMKNMIISLFNGYSGTQPTETTLETIVEMIRNDASTAEHTERHRYYRQQHMNTAAAREKAACPCFAVAVRFEGGKRKEHIAGYTLLCLADFDHVPEERMAECLQLIRQDGHTLMAYTTMSGTGIRVISRYERMEPCATRSDEELHILAFEAMNRYYHELTGLEADAKCRNLTRLSGLAHDPEVFFNPEAIPFGIQKVRQTASAKLTAGNNRLKRAVKAAEKQLAEEGIAYVEHHHNEYIMRMGYLLNAYGVDRTMATQWATERFADYDGDVEGIFHSCYRQTDEFGTRRLPSKKKEDGESGRDYASVKDIEEFLASQGKFRKNTVTGKCEFAPAENLVFADLTDRDVNTLWCRMCKEKKAVRIADLRSVLQSEFVELFNPFLNYMSQLPAWDGHTDYIGKLAAQVHVKDNQQLFATLFKKWLVAMIASLLNEEVVNHEILVLIGRQGIYKTTWLNNLLPPELRRYFYLKSNSRNISKDDMLTLAEFAMVCLEELDEMENKELNQLKALTTMRHVNERAAYAHFKEVRPHIASFCGTSNNPHFLTDLSGNRRWMPFEVESIDSPFDHPVDYEGVYAQAFALATGDFQYWLSTEEMVTLNQHNKLFEVPCLEQELILTHYRRPLEGEECIFVTNAQILARINAGLRHKLNPVKIGMVMKQEGFKSVRVGGKRGYLVIELSGDEIYRNQQALGRYL